MRLSSSLLHRGRMAVHHFVPLRCCSPQDAQSFPILQQGWFFNAYFGQESLKNFRRAGISRGQVVHHAGTALYRRLLNSRRAGERGGARPSAPRVPRQLAGRKRKILPPEAHSESAGESARQPPPAGEPGAPAFSHRLFVYSYTLMRLSALARLFGCDVHHR